MRKLFLSLTLLVGAFALSSFTANNNSADRVEKAYPVTITTTCGVTDTVWVSDGDSIYDMAMVLEYVFCD